MFEEQKESGCGKHASSLEGGTDLTGVWSLFLM